MEMTRGRTCRTGACRLRYLAVGLWVGGRLIGEEEHKMANGKHATIGHKSRGMPVDRVTHEGTEADGAASLPLALVISDDLRLCPAAL